MTRMGHLFSVLCLALLLLAVSCKGSSLVSPKGETQEIGELVVDSSPAEEGWTKSY